MNTDKPIKSPEFDLFNRVELSNKLAKLISEQDSGESLIIGLHGKWGTGKSSFLNLISCSDFLKENSKKQKVIHFNPWLFSTKEQMISEFFQSIVSVIKPNEVKTSKSHTKWKCASLLRKLPRQKTGLENDWEAIFPLITSLAKGTPYFGEGIANLGGMFSPSLSQLHERLVNLLKKESKNIVVFIDDIDRLEDDEVYLIFKLVKLFGNLPGVNYVLSFDRDMVAKQINSRFGGDGGSEFLEKIIQLPVQLPPLSLIEFCDFWFNQLKMAFGEDGLGLENEARVKNVLDNRLYRPEFSVRLVFKHANAIRFANLSLKGEVDPIDLIVIEFIRLINPKIHELIYFNENEIFSFFNTFRASQGGERTSPELTDKLEGMFGINLLTKNEDRKYYTALISFLFPSIRFGIDGAIKEQPYEPDKYAVDLRIGSSIHFSKYFKQVVGSGMIKESEYAQLVQAWDSGSDYLSLFSSLIIKYSPAELLSRFRVGKEKLKPNMCSAIIESFAKNADSFSVIDESSRERRTLINEVCVSILMTINRLSQSNLKFGHLKQAFEESGNNDFNLELLELVIRLSKDIDPVFYGKEFERMFVDTIDEIIAKVGLKEILRLRSGRIFLLFKKWKEYNPIHLDKAVDQYLMASTENTSEFIYHLAPNTLHIKTNPTLAKMDLEDELFKIWTDLIPFDEFVKKLKIQYGEELNESYVRGRNHEPQIDVKLNLARQFYSLYLKSNNPKS